MASDSRSIAAHDLIAYGGGLFGTGVLLHQAWSGASIEHVLSSAAMSGLVAYLTLAVGFAAARSIITASPGPEASTEPPDALPEKSAPEPDEPTPESDRPAAKSEGSSSEPEGSDNQTAPEPQAA